jgi:PKD repeat protein
MDDANVRNPKVVLGSPGSYDVTLTITKDGNSYSKTIFEMLTTVECPSLNDCSNPAFLDKSIWELEYVNSEEVNFPGLATMAFDNDPATIWHTRWSTGSDPYPHEIQIDLGDIFDVHEFIYYPRQNGQNGWIKDYELYFSEDLADWGQVDATGAFESSAAPQKVVFQLPETGRYFKLVALSEANGKAWASASEFEIKGCYNETTSIQHPIDYESLKAFPVPTKGLFEVSLPSSALFNYSIYTLTGQLIDSGQSNVGSESIQFDLSGYANSMYVIKLADRNNRSYYIKVLKAD